MDKSELIELMSFLDSKLGSKVYQGLRLNQYATHPRVASLDGEGVELFNEVYTTLLKTGLGKIKRTKSGALASGMANGGNMAAWDVVTTSIGVRLTVIVEGWVYVLKVGTFKTEKDPGIYPAQAFMEFKEACMAAGIDLDLYADDNGAEIKKEIPPAPIAMARHMKETDKGLKGANHLDFHSSYPAGLCNKHPEFRKVVEPIYERRKADPSCKAMLNYAIGCMQSPKEPFKSRWARLAKDAIEDNMERINDMICRLVTSGREILGINTDGIWYLGEPYHGEGEGEGLGQWRNDHVNCLFRSKTDGSYEFIEDGKYCPVVRGLTTLDRVKPRSEWEWGDIYKGSSLAFEFKEGIGLGLLKGEIHAQ